MTIQALLDLVPGTEKATWRTLQATGLDSVNVNWGTTLVAQAIGLKVAEAYLADGGRGSQVKALLETGAALASELELASAQYEWNVLEMDGATGSIYVTNQWRYASDPQYVIQSGDRRNEVNHLIKRLPNK